MKLAFSSIGCPAWDLPTMVQKALEYGFSGIELRGLQGQMHLPLAPQLSSNPAKISRLMRDAGVDLVCLSTSAAFHMRERADVVRNMAEVREYIELAGELECPFVRVFGSEIPKARFIGYENREAVLARIGDALLELAPFAAQHRVTLLIENNNDFSDSRSMWYLVDAANTPAVKCCWNQLNGRLRRERPTTSIPRLGARIGLVHLCDAKISPEGGFNGYALPGEGDVEIPRLMQLLRGIGYRGHVVFDWPKLWNPTLADPDQAFAAAADYLKKILAEKPLVLTAYKGDKNAPRQGYELLEKAGA